MVDECRMRSIRAYGANLTKELSHFFVSHTALLFYHAPLCTQNPEAGVTPSSMLGDKNLTAVDFSTQIGMWSSEGNPEVYDLIVNNADVIGGCFCGHFHCDFYTELKAKTADGEDTVIPQYVLIGTPYNKGHIIKITVK